MGRPTSVTREDIYMARWGDPVAKEKVIFAFTKFIWKICWETFPHLADRCPEDVLSVGIIGVLEAVQDWDEDRGTFPTYAAHRIRAQLKIFNMQYERSRKILHYQNCPEQTLKQREVPTATNHHCVTCEAEIPNGTLCKTCDKQITRMRYYHNVPGVCPNCVVPLRVRSGEPYCPSCNYNPNIHRYE